MSRSLAPQQIRSFKASFAPPKQSQPDPVAGHHDGDGSLTFHHSATLLGLAAGRAVIWCGHRSAAPWMDPSPPFILTPKIHKSPRSGKVAQLLVMGWWLKYVLCALRVALFAAFIARLLLRGTLKRRGRGGWYFLVSDVFCFCATRRNQFHPPPPKPVVTLVALLWWTGCGDKIGFNYLTLRSPEVSPPPLQLKASFASHK